MKRWMGMVNAALFVMFQTVAVAAQDTAQDLEAFLPSIPGNGLYLSISDLPRKLTVDYWMVCQQYAPAEAGSPYAVYSLCNHYDSGLGRYSMGWFTLNSEDGTKGQFLNAYRYSYTGDNDNQPLRFLKYVSVPADPQVGATWDISGRFSMDDQEVLRHIRWKVVDDRRTDLAGIGERRVLTVSFMDDVNKATGTYDLAAGIGLVGMTVNSAAGQVVARASLKEWKVFPPALYRGRVTGNGKPLANLVFSLFRKIPGRGPTAKSDRNGDFVFPALYGKDALVWMGWDRDEDGRIDGDWGPAPMNTIFRNMDIEGRSHPERVDGQMLEDMGPGPDGNTSDIPVATGPINKLGKPEDYPFAQAGRKIADSAEVLEGYKDSHGSKMVLRGRSTGRTLAIVSSDPATQIVVRQGLRVVDTIAGDQGFLLAAVLEDSDWSVEISGVGFNTGAGHFNASAQAYSAPGALDAPHQAKSLLASWQKNEKKGWVLFVGSDGVVEELVRR